MLLCVAVGSVGACAVHYTQVLSPHSEIVDEAIMTNDDTMVAQADIDRALEA